MAFLRTTFGSEPPAVLRGHGVWLRLPVMADYGPWAELRALSRSHLTPWEPRWTLDELSRATFRLRVRHASRESREDLAYPFLIFRSSDDALLGGVTLSNVRRGVAQTATLGYWMGAPFAGRGYMRLAVATALDHAFDGLGLHRIEAACLPTNAASMRVLEATGFTREGFARRYLKIDGNWQDHVLFGRLREDPPGQIEGRG